MSETVWPVTVPLAMAAFGTRNRMQILQPLAWLELECQMSLPGPYGIGGDALASVVKHEEEQCREIEAGRMTRACCRRDNKEMRGNM